MRLWMMRVQQKRWLLILLLLSVLCMLRVSGGWLSGVRKDMLPLATVTQLVSVTKAFQEGAKAWPQVMGLPDFPSVPEAGSAVLKPLDAQCANETPDANINFLSTSKIDAKAQWRRDFVCTAGCAEREPELEHSLAPYAEWERNTTGLEMIDLMHKFCEAKRSCKDPFVLAALWEGDVWLRACGAEGLKEVSLYLIGPEDLSLVLTFLFSAMRVAVLPKGPTVFGMYLSDYSCLVDKHLIGPGIPIFSYLRRETSWLIPWPSSFTVHSTYQLEQSRIKEKAAGIALDDSSRLPTTKPWSERKPTAYWIGAITGPWELQADADIAAIPRMKLLRLSAENPKDVQAEWSSLASYGITWVHEGKTVGGLGRNGTRTVEQMTGNKKAGYKPLEQWKDFKYYINLDGVVMGGRFNKLMALGGVVLQHKAGYYEHVDALAKPFEHYVPIEYDLSDLLPKVRWLQEHDAEARRIAENAERLAKQRMRLEDHLCYVWRALEALGSKTASAPADPDKVTRRLDELHYQRVKLVNEDMRQTMEAFWGAKLEDVRVGDRQMTKNGIKLIQWAWDRFGELWKRSHK